MMSSFFGLLPADLQVEVLFVWLNSTIDDVRSLLRAMSALDIACSKTLQPLFRGMIRQLPPLGDKCANSSQKSSALSSYIRWLDSRSVSVQSLHLSGASAFTDDTHDHSSQELSLSSIRHLHWREVCHVSSIDAQQVLRALPNLTAIHCDAFPAFVDVIAELTPKLTIFSRNEKSNNCPSSMTTICSQLLELRLPACALNDQLADIICTTCSKLQLLACSATPVHEHSTRDLEQIGDTCGNLTTLILHFSSLYDRPAQELCLAAAVLPRIKILHIHRSDSASSRTSWLVFASIVKLRRDFDCLQVAQLKLSPAEGILNLSSIWDSDVDVIINLCSPLVRDIHLALDHNLSSEEAEQLKGTCLGAKLKYIAVASHCREPSLLLQCCGPQLAKLGLQGDATTDIYNLITTCGRQLGFIAIIVLMHVCPTDARLLIAACPNLEALSLSSLLPAGDFEDHFMSIISPAIFRLARLRMLVLRSNTLHSSTVQWFREQCRARQLLPVPDVIMIDD